MQKHEQTSLMLKNCHAKLQLKFLVNENKTVQHCRSMCRTLNISVSLREVVRTKVWFRSDLYIQTICRTNPIMAGWLKINIALLITLD